MVKCTPERALSFNSLMTEIINVKKHHMNNINWETIGGNTIIIFLIFLGIKSTIKMKKSLYFIQFDVVFNEKHFEN